MKILLRLGLTLMLVLALTSEGWARGAKSGGGSFGGSSRSSSSSSSSSRSSGSSSWGSGSRSSGGSSWGSGSRVSSGQSSSAARRTEPSSSGSSSGWGSSSSTSTTRSAPNSSATDRALASKVGRGGSTFTSRGEAVRDFESKYASQYTSRFPTQPGTRPSYIPQTTTIDGRPYPVGYDPAQGAYGSWVGNRFSAFDVMRDVMVVNALMGQHNYSYGAPTSSDYGSRPEYYRETQRSGSGGGMIILIILVIGGVIVWQYYRARAAIRANPFSAGATIPPGGGGGQPARNLSTSPMDKSKPADWLALKPGSIVTISDEQGIADSMKRGLGVRGIDYTVQSVAEMKQVDGLSTHLFLTLQDPEQSTYLLVKIVDEEIDLGLFFSPENLASGTRQEIVDRGDLWLFQEPANPNNFHASDLRYTTTIRQTLPGENGQPEEILYELKGQGELQCSYREQPVRTGMGDALATVAEYRTAQATENPELLVLEVGVKRGTSSYVQFFLGCPIKFSEVDVLPA